MVRTPYIDGKGLKRGAWSEEEDNKLREYILRYKAWNWNHLPRFAGLSRCGKSCRMRWENYLKPGVKRGGFSKDDEELIFKMQKQHGNKWSLIARKLPGRTDNEIKNYWHTILSKRTKQGAVETSSTCAASAAATNITYVDESTDIILAATQEEDVTEPLSMENLISSSASTDFNFQTSTSCTNSGRMESQIPWSPDSHFQTSTLLSRLDSLESFGFWEALWNFSK